MSSKCANCGKEEGEGGAFKRCNDCQIVGYCSPACEAEDYEAHKEKCKAMASMAGWRGMAGLDICDECEGGDDTSPGKDEGERLITPNSHDMAELEGPIFVMPFPRGVCKCGRDMCKADDPSPMWRSEIFMGNVSLLTGEMKKLDNPRDLLKGEDYDISIESNLPGHLMNMAELM